MSKNMPALIVGILCIVVAIAISIINKRISVGTIAALIIAIIAIIKGLGLRWV